MEEAPVLPYSAECDIKKGVKCCECPEEREKKYFTWNALLLHFMNKKSGHSWTTKKLKQTELYALARKEINMNSKCNYVPKQRTLKLGPGAKAERSDSGDEGNVDRDGGNYVPKRHRKRSSSGPNMPSHDFVAGAVADSSRQPIGAFMSEQPSEALLSHMPISTPGTQPEELSKVAS